MPYNFFLQLWESMKETTDTFKAFVLMSLSILIAAIFFVFNTLSAQSAIIEQKLDRKIEKIESYSVPRAELVQLEKRLEAIHADIREIRNSQKR